MHSLTIATAVYRSFDSLWFTLQDLRKSHGYGFDLLALDNAPESCQRTQSTCHATRAKYVHRPDLHGTSRPRDACFHYADTPWVMVVDDHVLLDNGAVAHVLDFIKRYPDSNDIHTGPIIGDDGIWAATHWAPKTPRGIWGTWATHPDFAKRWGEPATHPGWTHAAARTAVAHMEPFEIPMQGLGLWLMRKAAWPGFNPYFRGFGGEEGYIQNKVRKLGGKALCHPRLRWHHKFRDIGGSHDTVPYPLSLEDHVRNMLFGVRELGMEGAEEEICADPQYGGALNPDTLSRILYQVRSVQKFNDVHTHQDAKKKKILALWYTNNAAPESLMRRSLNSVADAVRASHYDVRVGTCVWQPIPGNPFPQALFDSSLRHTSGHATIARQMRAAWRVGVRTDDWQPDIIVHCEHDVLYAPGYFDRVGLAFRDHPEFDAVSHRDYIGLNASGWLKTQRFDDPMHQLSLRADYARRNLDRIEDDLKRGVEIHVEPEYGGARERWIYLPPDGYAPSVHVNW